MNINNPTLSVDAEAGFQCKDDHVLIDSAIIQDHVPTGNGSNLSLLQNNHEVTPANGENDRPNNPNDDRPFPYVQIRAPLSEKRKKNFTICWCSFVMLNLVFLVVVALKLPMYPLFDYYLTIPIFEQESVNYTREKNNTVYLAIKFTNPNPLVSYSYHEIFKIDIDYYLPRSKEGVRFASIVYQGADQFKVRDGKATVRMLASGLPGLLQLNKSFNNLDFYMYFEFSASCRGLCNYKLPYYHVQAYMEYTPEYWPNI